MRYVPVVDRKQRPLMPTSNWKADKLIASGKALRRFRAGIFYIQLVDRNGGNTQQTVVGIDPGSKREGFTVKSNKHTYLNILSEAVTWVKGAVEQRSQLRRTRRSRNTPYRMCRKNRTKGGIPPSTKARWGAKLRIVNILYKLFPITDFVVEDVKAKTMKNGRKWNVNFSPIEVGKKYFYTELGKLGTVYTKEGMETCATKEYLGLKKVKAKLSDVFEAHCVDSWVLANILTGGHTEPDNKQMLKMIPLQFHRRQLSVLNAIKGGIKKNYGSTMSFGIKRGSLVKSKKYGINYVGGTSKGKISLHNIESGNRVTQGASVGELVVLCFNYWRTTLIPPPPKGRGLFSVTTG
jgi:hypothetical protein